MTDTGDSPQHTVTFGAGVADVLQACLTRLQDTVADEAHAETYDDLEKIRSDARAQTASFLSAFVGSLLLLGKHRGNIHLAVFGPESLSFHCADGYHGAMVLHTSEQNPRKASWSVHT